MFGTVRIIFWAGMLGISIFRKDVVIELFQYKDTDDYYIVILGTNESKYNITDSCGSVFVSPESNPHNRSCFYSANVLYSEHYWISINGQKFSFKDM